jgi:hypothetical protein
MAVTGPGSHIQASRFADPCRDADVTLATAVRAQAMTREGAEVAEVP